jgi:hypothetical protein
LDVSADLVRRARWCDVAEPDLPVRPERPSVLRPPYGSAVRECNTGTTLVGFGTGHGSPSTLNSWKSASSFAGAPGLETHFSIQSL